MDFGSKQSIHYTINLFPAASLQYITSKLYFYLSY